MNTGELFDNFLGIMKQKQIPIIKTVVERKVNDDYLTIWLPNATKQEYNKQKCIYDNNIRIVFCKRLNLNDVSKPIYSIFFHVEGKLKRNQSFENETLLHYYETTLNSTLKDVVQNFITYYNQNKNLLYSPK